MKIVVISDTHNQHDALGSLRGDLLIHGGDFGMGFGPPGSEVEPLDRWFAKQHFGAMVCVGGNHDFATQRRAVLGQPVFRHAHCLQDEAFEFAGCKLYGSPWVPELADWAFHAEPAALQQRWNAIPDDTDILVTHTPPQGPLDRNSSGRSCGCPLLRDRPAARRLRLHCVGPMHASAGTLMRGETQFVNAAVVGRSYRVVREPVTVVFWGPRAGHRFSERRPTMARIESRLTALGLARSPPITSPPGVALPFQSARELALPIIASRVEVEAEAGLVE